MSRNVSKCLEMSQNKSPNRKRKIKLQIEIGKSKWSVKKKQFLRPRCKIAVKITVYNCRYPHRSWLYVDILTKNRDSTHCKNLKIGSSVEIPSFLLGYLFLTNYKVCGGCMQNLQKRWPRQKLCDWRDRIQIFLCASALNFRETCDWAD